MDSEEVVPQVFCRIEKVTNTPSNIEYSIILININLINNLSFVLCIFVKLKFIWIFFFYRAGINPVFNIFMFKILFYIFKLF